MQYLLVVNGKPEGPYTITELKQKRIKANDFVRTDDMDDYKEAHEVEELRELFGFKKEHLNHNISERLISGYWPVLLIG